MDPKRVKLSYLFFGLGMLLTVYQINELLTRGHLEPWLRQVAVIVINTLAVWTGALLAYPWQAQGRMNYEVDEAVMRPYQRIMWISLIFCFIIMLGITFSLLFTNSGSGGQGVDVRAEQETVFPWVSYGIATFYMVGYGVLGVGLHVVRWIFRATLNETQENTDSPVSSPRKKPKKRKSYPIDSVYVLGKIRKKGTGSKKIRTFDDD